MLELDLATILFEILNFLVLGWLLYRFLLQPVMERVRERAAEKEQRLREIQEERAAAADLKSKWEARLAQAETEAADILNEAQLAARQEREALLQEAQAEAERMLVQSQLEATRQQKQAVGEFHEALLDTILDLSGRVVGRVAPPELHAALVQQLTERVLQLGHEMQRLEAVRRSLPETTPRVDVTTARPLTAEQQGQLARTFTALADRHVSLEITTDSRLAAGLRARLGDMIVDNSIAGQLANLRPDVAQWLDARAPVHHPETEGNGHV